MSNPSILKPKLRATFETLKPSTYEPRPPFTLSEFESGGAKPLRTYTKQELLDYLDDSRNKCHDIISGFTEASAGAAWKNEWKESTVVEMLIYNLRHVQHHTAQLNLILRREINDAPKWVSLARRKLND